MLLMELRYQSVTVDVAVLVPADSDLVAFTFELKEM